MGTSSSHGSMLYNDLTVDPWQEFENNLQKKNSQHSGESDENIILQLRHGKQGQLPFL